MSVLDFFADLQNTFASSDIARMIFALRQDSAIWNSLLAENFSVATIQVEGSDLEQMSPANLGLKLLGVTTTAGEITADPKNPLNDNLQERGIKAYEALLEGINPNYGLAQITLAALALREKHRTNDSWDEIIGSLPVYTQPGNKDLYSTWQPVLICLFGMIDTQQELLFSLNKQNNDLTNCKLISHIVLGNPINTQLQQSLFLNVIEKKTIFQQMTWLRLLKQEGNDGLVNHLSGAIIAGLEENNAILLEANLFDSNIETLYSTAFELQLRGGLYQLNGQLEQAGRLYGKAQELLYQCQVGIDIERIDLSDHQKFQPDLTKPIIVMGGSENFEQLDDQSNFVTDDNTLLNNHIVENIPELDHNPLIQIQKALQIFRAGERDLAQGVAIEAVQSLIKDFDHDQVIGHAIYPINWDACKTVDQIIELGLYDQALQAASCFLKARPADTGLLDRISTLLKTKEDPSSALESAQISMLLDMDNPETHRQLGGLWETLGKPDKSNKEWRKVIDISTQPEISDWLAYAQSGLNVDDYEQALTASSKVLDSNPNLFAAYIIKGKAFIKLGKNEEACEILEKITTIYSEGAEPWLLLSDIYQLQGRITIAIETLQNAYQAFPESEVVNYKLALANINTGLDEEALPYLRKAASLAPESSDIALSLGKTLQKIGLLGEACEVIEFARQKWQNDPKLAYTHARILFDLGKVDLALSPMEVVIQNEAPSYQNFIMYADALLGGKTLFLLQKNMPDMVRLSKAKEALETSINLNPESIEASILLAEVLLTQGAYKNAYKQYQQLLDLPISNLPQWRWRIQAGFGKVALKLNEVETALAVLKEAALEQPDHIEIIRMLAEAYQMSDLTTEAFQTASYVLKTMPDDPGNLTWYAGMVLSLGEESEALEALQNAARIEPENPDLWIQLAELQSNMNNLDGVKLSLARLLDINELQVHHWRRAAYLFIHMGDQLASLSCLEQALQLEHNTSANIYFEMACIQQRIGEPETALEAIQNAILHSENESYLFVFESDLLSILKRPEDAIISLNKAFNLEEKNQEMLHIAQRDYLSDIAEILPENWLDSIHNFGGYTIRFADLLQKTGHIEEAITQASLAIEKSPENLAYRCLAADLARISLTNDKAYAYFDNLEMSHNGDQYQNANLWTTYLSIQAEIAFDRGVVEEAVSWVERGSKITNTNVRFMAIKSRVLAQQGEWTAAREIFDSLWENSQKELSNIDSSSLDDSTGYRMLENYFKANEIWLAEAALDVYEWKKAIQILENLALQKPEDARVAMSMAKTIVSCAEYQRLFEEIFVSSHAPGKEILGDYYYEKFNKSVQVAATRARPEDIHRLSLRGQLAFHPNLETIKLMDWKKVTSTEAIQISAHLRRMNEISASISVILQLPVTAETSIHQALCYQEKNVENGLKASQNAVQVKPNHPITLAVLSILAKKSDKTDLSLDALEHALEIWENEPEWQAMAAGLSAIIGKHNESISHWEKATKLDPTFVEYSIALSKEYLAVDDKRKSIHVLEVACKTNPQNFDIHYSLARVLLMAGKVNEAFDFAERASRINPTGIDNLMVCAEASFELRKWQSALDYANQIMNIDHNNANGVLFISKVFSTQGKLQEALDVIDTSSSDILSFESVAFERIKLLRKLKGARAAIQPTQELSRLFSRNPYIFKFLAEIQSELGDNRDAQESAEVSLKLLNEQPDLYHMLGLIKKTAGELDQAVHYLNEAVRLNPNDLEAYTDLGQTYVEKHEFLLALRVYEQIIKKIPDDYKPYYSAALVLREIKDYKSAEVMLRKAADLSSDDLNIRRQLGAVIALNLVHNIQEAGPTV